MKVRILSAEYYDSREMLDKYPLLRNYGFEMVGNSRNDLDDLLRFIAELEIPVIFWYDYDNGTYNIEIYNDYRE